MLRSNLFEMLLHAEPHKDTNTSKPQLLVVVSIMNCITQGMFMLHSKHLTSHFSEIISLQNFQKMQEEVTFYNNQMDLVR